MTGNSRRNSSLRVVKAVHGVRQTIPDPQFELDLAADLRTRLNRDQLIDTFVRFSVGTGHVDALMRRVCLRALAKQLGSGLTIGRNVSVSHPETFEIGDGVFIGDQSIIQGRFDGQCIIGNGVWIGPQSYFDARDLVLEDYVGWGPGARVLGSEHTGVPVDIPTIRTDLEIRPVRVCAWADIGMNAILLPGVTIGRRSIVGAGAVVAADVPDFATVAGVPARVIGWSQDPESTEFPAAISGASE
jgi:acetyltransferase-like isoleucine patch superfamily enzyme